MNSNIAILAGVRSSTCGGSAIAITTPITEIKDEKVVKSISVISLFNILAALISPALGDLLHLSSQGFTLFAGTAVDDTSPATATTTAWDTVHGLNALDGATIVGLIRTLATIPTTLGLSLYKAYQDSKDSRAKRTTSQLKGAFPMFVFCFLLTSIVAATVNGLGIDTIISDNPKTPSEFFIVMTMGVIGLNTNPIKPIKTGG